MNTETNILLAVPAYNGSIHTRCAQTLLWLDRVLNQSGISHWFRFIGNESLIPRARNCFANMAAFETDDLGKAYSHLMFIDSDISFAATEILTMLKADKPVVALPYTLKTINWSQVVEAVKIGVAADQLPRFAGTPVLAMYDRPFSLNEPTAVKNTGAGALLVKVDVLKALADANPAWKYRIGAGEINFRQSNGCAGPSDNAFDFFQVGADPETGFYLSEDFFFLEQVRRAGFETFVLPWVSTVHSGAFNYQMDIPAVASLSNKT